MQTSAAKLRLALTSAFLGGCALPAANLPAEPSPHLPAPRVVDISQWAPRDSLKPVLRQRSAPLVAYNEGHLEVLPGCALDGIFTALPLPLTPDAAQPPTLRLVESERDLDEQLPLRDPELVIDASASPGPLRLRELPFALMTIFTEEWKLVTLDHNDPPTSEACARATHLVTGVRFGASARRRHDQETITVAPDLPRELFDRDWNSDQLLEREARTRCADHPTDCAHPLVLTLVPIGAARADEAATLVHLRPAPGEDWSLLLNEAPLCKLPCDRWLLPGARVTLRRADGEVLILVDDFPGKAERDLVISTIRDPLYPWLGVIIAPFGLGFTALAIGLLEGGVSAGHPGGGSGSGSSGGAASGAATDLAAVGVVGVLGVALDAFSLVYLARGAQPVSTYRLQAPGTTAAGGARRIRSGPALSASPTGIGLAF